VIWLPAGLAEDVHLRATIVGDHVAWGAGGHTDEFVRFADERTVLLAWPGDDDVAANRVARLTRRRMQRNLEILGRATDARGRRLRVVKVPQPRLVRRRVVLDDAADGAWSEQWTPAWFPPHERRFAGQRLWQVATASYLNFVVVNGVLVLPDYVPHGTRPVEQERVRALFESIFAGRRVSFVDAMTANWVGGGLHCAMLNEPAAPT
jgi:agmatine deiminase